MKGRGVIQGRFRPQKRSMGRLVAPGPALALGAPSVHSTRDCCQGPSAFLFSHPLLFCSHFSLPPPFLLPLQATASPPLPPPHPGFRTGHGIGTCTSSRGLHTTETLQPGGFALAHPGQSCQSRGTYAMQAEPEKVGQRVEEPPTLPPYLSLTPDATALLALPKGQNWLEHQSRGLWGGGGGLLLPPLGGDRFTHIPANG